MLGIPDPQIWIAYGLCIFLAIACVVYGILNWNREREDIPGITESLLEGESDGS